MDPSEDEEMNGVQKDPSKPKNKESIYAAVSCRFSSSLHPSKKKINDKVTLVALGNFNKVLIFAVMSNNS